MGADEHMNGQSRTTSGRVVVWALAGALTLGATLSGCGERARDLSQLTGEDRRGEALVISRDAERLAAMGKTDDAILRYQEALSISGDLAGAWNNLGELYMRRGSYADAVSAFGVAAGLTPSDPRPVYNTGLVYQKVGWAKDAIDHYAEALKRDENMQEALRGHAVAADMLGRADDKTLEYIRRGLLRETDPEWREFFERQRFRVEAEMRALTRRGG
jgi:tetratricopeptide (TPR) repeat protein